MLETAKREAQEYGLEIVGWLCQWGKHGGPGLQKLPQFGLYGHAGAGWHRDFLERTPLCPECRPVFLRKDWQSPFAVERYEATV